MKYENHVILLSIVIINIILFYFYTFNFNYHFIRFKILLPHL